MLKSRYKVIGACLAAVLFMTLMFVVKGYEQAWELWNIPPMSPHFSDLRVITHGAESYAAGLDPMLDNPADPWQRKLNYPRVWQMLYPLGINASHTNALGVVIILSFLVGLCLTLPNLDNRTLLLLLAVLLSPATLLGVERANIDLLMFFLVALALVASQWSLISAMLVLLAGFALKLFPIFGWTMLVKTGKSSFVKFTGIALFLVGLHLVSTARDLQVISEGTPRSTFLSYGMNVYWMALSETHPGQSAMVKTFAFICAPLIILLALSALFRQTSPPEPAADSLSLDAFRSGAAIYVGTFLLGNNWDYRLIFLILTLPQLVAWTKPPGRLALLAKVIIAATLLSFWHMLIVKLLRPVDNGYLIGLTLDELANWMVFAGLAWLLFWTAPAWLNDLARKLLPQTGQPA